ncbi:DUF6069 family protein [Streptomonospora sp. S1-112]|uniref:DUF6069 family protein n=1 Tax=Streptomonospora mangrovi TaxID=2883123 RepID=A0A9X3NHB0_9ACTN|nr:DUF6069 family protein [Streptomonospora mangrovi]MDA0563632.1 DUF6069 family protein [Streptomonospora mangrovi]
MSSHSSQKTPHAPKPAKPAKPAEWPESSPESGESPGAPVGTATEAATGTATTPTTRPGVVAIAATAGRRRVRRALAVGGAVAASLGVWAAAVAVGVEVEALQGNTVQPVGPVPVAVASLAAGLAGWALLAVLERTMKRRNPYRLWTATAAAVLLLSLVGPLTSGTAPATTWTLVLLHTTPAAILIPLLPRAACR